MRINSDINPKRSLPLIYIGALVWCLIVLGAPLIPRPAGAVTATITNPGDSDNPTAGMLRKAINDPAVNTIVFASGVNLINLTGGALVIDRDLTIKGDLETVTISRSAAAGSNFRIFHITDLDGTPIVVTLENLIISGGYDSICGAGLYCDFEDAVISVNQCVIKNNQVDTGSGFGAGITIKAGTLALYESSVENNVAAYGAGVLVESMGVFSMDNSYVAGNHAQGTGIGQGGGLYLLGTCSIFQSAIAENKAENSGGGVFIDNSVVTISHSTINDNEALNGVGGGIYNAGLSTNLLTSTISGNKAAGSPGQGGGIYVSLPVGDPYPEKVSGQARYLFEMVIRACTIADNNAVNDGGGLGVIQGDVYLYNTILARNSAGGTGPDCYTDPGLDITSQGYNLIQDDTGFTIIPGTGDIQADPIMGLLADNGGPTKTHALFSPSPALEAGDPEIIEETDQRSVDRPQGANSDIGSYEAAHYLIDLIKTGGGQGTVSSTPRGIPDGIDCPETCTSQTAVYAERTSNVLLTASPAGGSDFVGWSGDCTGTGPCVLEMDGDKSVTAIFQISYELTAAVTPEGAGTVSGAGTYYVGSQAIVKANPAPGWVFDHWSGDYFGTENPIELIMDADKSVTANFKKLYTLTTQVDPEGAGTVEGGGQFPSGTTATLTATANAGWMFDRWSGCVESANNPVQVVMNGDKAVTAHFVEIPAETYTLTIEIDPAGGGTVSGGGTYPAGQTATVEATPAGGWFFHSWTGDINTTDNPASVVMDGNKTVTARFSEDGGYTISLTGGTEQSYYRIVPVGAYNTNSKPSNVFGIPVESYDKEMMSIGRWNQNLGDYRTLPDMDGSESALPGWGAWFLFRNDTELKISGLVPVLENGPDGAKGVVFKLKKGWNQVGNPFNHPIWAAKIVLMSGSPVSFWYWDGYDHWIVDAHGSVGAFWGGWIWADQDEEVFFDSEEADPPEDHENSGLIAPAADVQSPPAPPSGLSSGSSSSLSEGGGGGGGCFINSLGQDKTVR